MIDVDEFIRSIFDCVMDYGHTVPDRDWVKARSLVKDFLKEVREAEPNNG